MRKLTVIMLTMAFVPLSLFGLSFTDVAAGLELVDEVFLARVGVDLARQELSAAGYVGDYSLIFAPSTSLTADETEIKSVGISAGFTLSAPIGFGDDAIARVERAAESLSAAQRNLDLVRKSTYVRLYGLYQDAWMAQEEIPILDAELGVAERTYEIAQALFAEGAITLGQLSSAMEDLQRAQTERDQGTLTERLAWLELAFTAGIDPAEQPVLEPFLIFSIEPPKPPELSEWAIEHDALIAAQIAAIAALQRELALPVDLVSAGTARLQFSLWDHSASVTYAFATPTITASYNTPDLYLYSSGSASKGAVPISVGLSATLSVSGANEQEFARATIAIEIEREENRLATLYDTVDVAIRAAYQQMHRSIDAVAQAERALESASDNAAVVGAKETAGRAVEVDRLQADVLVLRAEQNLVAAQIAREKATMNVAMAASYFEVYYRDVVVGEGGER